MKTHSFIAHVSGIGLDTFDWTVRKARKVKFTVYEKRKETLR